MNKRLKLKKHYCRKHWKQKVNIRKGIKFGNKILEEKNIGEKLFCNSLERKFGRTKILDRTKQKK